MSFDHAINCSAASSNSLQCEGTVTARRCALRAPVLSARVENASSAASDPATTIWRGALTFAGAPAVAGYEIHMGETEGPALAKPVLSLAGSDAGDAARPDGALSDDGQILATYVHGLFDSPDACAALLEWAGLSGAQRVDYPALREASLERLADTLAESLDVPRIYDAIGRGVAKA